MRYTEYTNADDFLAVAGPLLKRDEAVNGLMLGIARRLREDLFAHGSQPLLATVGESDAPVLIALMTPPYKLQITAGNDAWRDAVSLLVAELQARAWPVPAVIGRRDVAEALSRQWTTATGTPSRPGTEQRIYELREVHHPDYPPGNARKATIADLDTASELACAFHAECFGVSEPDRAAEMVASKIRSGTLWFWMTEEPVSMAVRTRPTPHGEAVGLVYTPPEHRRHGYATALVARLSQQILDEGKQFSTLFTDLANPTSNSIYQQIGYRVVADVVDVHFGS